MTAQSILDSPPPAKEFERFDDTLMGEAFDLLSPSYWVLKILSYLNFDPMKMIVKPFSGDYEAAGQHASAYGQLGEAFDALADELGKRARDMTAQGMWEGNASANFDAHMTELAGGVRTLGANLKEASAGFDDAAQRIYGQYMIASQLLTAFLDYVTEAVLDAVSGIGWPALLEKFPRGVGLVRRIRDWFDRLADISRMLRAELLEKIGKLIWQGTGRLGDALDFGKYLNAAGRSTRSWGTLDDIGMGALTAGKNLGKLPYWRDAYDRTIKSLQAAHAISRNTEINLTTNAALPNPSLGDETLGSQPPGVADGSGSSMFGIGLPGSPKGELQGVSTTEVNQKES
jgi:barrier-to-autointegration factor